MSELTNPTGTISSYQLQNATRTLQQFDDRILADIGLRRAEIEHAVRNGRSAMQKTVPNRQRSQQRHAA